MNFSIILASLISLASSGEQEGSNLGLNDTHFARRVTAYLTLKDYHAAVNQAQEALQEHPDSLLLKEMLIRSLALDGHDREALFLFESSKSRFDKELRLQLLEEIAWSTLSKGNSSSSLILRVYSMIGALLTQDVNAVALLESQLSDSNRIIRSVALELVGYMGDEPLKQTIRNRLAEEQSSDVRHLLIRAVGKLRIKDCADFLQKVVADPKCRAEERAAAIESLVQLYDKVSPEELRRLSRSDRAGLRILACELASHYECPEALEDLAQLIEDPHAPVRAEACRLFGLGIIPMQLDKIRSLMNDPDPLVALTAIWSIYPHCPDEAILAIKPWLSHQNSEIAVMAAAALAHCGDKAKDQLADVMRSHDDIFVAANCALGLIGLRSHVDEACDVICDLLRLESLLMKDEVGGFTLINKSKIRHHPIFPNFPEANDQMTRLELLGTLSILHSPRAKEGLELFLREKNWGVSGIAATTLLQEGDDSAIGIIKELLDDASPDVRIQAALVLASWLKDKSALTVLQSAYGEVDREMKIKILEAIGTLGDSDCLPFLIERLHEPFQAERIVAAFAIIRCLNH